MKTCSLCARRVERIACRMKVSDAGDWRSYGYQLCEDCRNALARLTNELQRAGVAQLPPDEVEAMYAWMDSRAALAP